MRIYALRRSRSASAGDTRPLDQWPSWALQSVLEIGARASGLNDVAADDFMEQVRIILHARALGILEEPVA